MNYKPTIGLEVHVELNTQSKMFCSCRNNSDAVAPNSQICPICMAHPGTLPVANNEAIRKTIKTGLALNCKIAEVSKFDRKNYFYPDLPKGYQVSQYDMPFCEKGFLEISGNPPSQKASARQSPPSLKATARQEKIRITRIHLEEDTGRLIHSGDSSLVDFNRAGVPLMELVTEPDIASGKEARAFAQELQLILRYLGVSEADMEKGQMRVEVNISLSKSKKLGTKVEIKNLNSFRVVERAADYEIKRQTEVLEQGGKIIQETRGWNDSKGITFSQREKEEAHDYRYFPEPDLPVIYLDKKFIEEIRAEIPELPEQKRKRFSEEYGLEKQNVEVFVVNKNLSEYFEKVISELDKKDPKTIQSAVNYILTDLQGLLKGAAITDESFMITPENFGEFITLIQDINSSAIAKTVLREMFSTGADPSHIIEEKGLNITNESDLENIVKEVISQNSKPAEDFKNGKENALQFLIGQVMAKSRGKASPQAVRQALLTKLK